ncbi:Clr5 domain-containing protein [Colletotrichum navitas]|uniref:Clr5 domain-containing protein n=1 Tax=Colletotrichum navitas TaxID=681940 RepID=A0AAD8PYI2_9PEZI|nr:Clr5 domain-containing protein [Colletotrichum navitas]KAK1590002.1 Clr5 domain-containing protein [Colletotrichum navitas]
MTKAWGEKRADITRLYIDENKTLNEVKAIMEEHHDFKASTRSYRQQFDKWGLAKYNCKKRTARRRSQDTSGHQLHHQSTGKDYFAEEVSGGGGGGIDFTIADLHAYDQPMSPRSCGSSLSSESAVDGGFVDEIIDVTGTTTGSQAPDASYARDWPPQLPYSGGARRQQQNISYPQYTQQQQIQQDQQHTQQPQHQRRCRSSWNQQEMAQSPHGTLPSPPADLRDDSSYYLLFANEASASHRPVRPQTYPVLHPSPRHPESYLHQQPPSQYQSRQRQQQQQLLQQLPRSQMYSSAPLMSALRDSAPYHVGVECATVRQPAQQ